MLFHDVFYVEKNERNEKKNLLYQLTVPLSVFYSHKVFAWIIFFHLLPLSLGVANKNARQNTCVVLRFGFSFK